MSSSIQGTNLFNTLTQNNVENYLKSNWFGKIFTLIRLSIENKEFVTERKIIDVMLEWGPGRKSRMGSIIDLAAKKMNMSTDTARTIRGKDLLRKTNSLAAKILLHQDTLKSSGLA